MQFSLFGTEETVNNELREQMKDSDFFPEVDFENSAAIIIEIDNEARRDLPMTDKQKRSRNSRRRRK